ncbi:Hypothetical predicted protein, partial [Marmota monax]
GLGGRAARDSCTHREAPRPPPPLTCRRRRRLWAALTGAALVRDRSGAAAASAAPRPGARPPGPKRLQPRLSGARVPSQGDAERPQSRLCPKVQRRTGDRGARGRGPAVGGQGS